MSVVQKLRKVPLAQHFIHAHGHAVGKVQAAAGVAHGHSDAVLLIGGKQGFGQAGILASEHEVCTVRVAHIGVALRCLGGKIVIGAAVFGKELVQTVVIADVEVVPVIQTCMIELFIIDGKAHGAYQIQPTGSAGTGAGHIAGVLRDARLHQNDVQGWLFVHRCTSPYSAELAGHRRGRSGSNQTP